MLERLGVARERARLVAREDQELVGARVARLGPVVREHAVELGGAAREQLLERGRDLAVEPLSLALQDALVDGLANDVVREDDITVVALPADLDERRADKRAERLVEAVARLEPPQQWIGDAPAGDRGSAGEPDRRLVEPIDPRRDDVANRPGRRPRRSERRRTEMVAGLNRQPGDLLDEERVAAGLRERRAQERLRRLLAQHLAGEHRALLCGERGELDRGGVRQHRREPLGRLARPARADHEQPGRGRERKEMAEQVRRRGVRPVPVLADEHERLPAGEPREQAAPGAQGLPPEGLVAEQPHPVGERGRQLEAEQPAEEGKRLVDLVEEHLGEQTLELGEAGGLVVGAGDARPAPQQPDEREVAEAVAVEDRTRLEPEDALVVRAAACLGDQARLPYARRAGDQYDAAPPVVQRAERGVQRRHLLLPADEPRAPVRPRLRERLEARVDVRRLALPLQVAPPRLSVTEGTARA